MTTETPAAVLWDMDGTLVDTEPYWLVAERELANAHGASWSFDDGLKLVGQGLEYTAAALQDRGVELPVPEIIDWLTNKVLSQTVIALPWRPGALELLLSVREAGIPTALVTMSMKPLAEHVASSLDQPLFDVIVTGDDVEYPKPHPEPYERAARMLHVDITSCIAIEDSIPGLASASASGAVTIGVPAHVDLPPEPGYTLWPTLVDRTADDLVTLYQANRDSTSLRKDLE